MSDKLKKYLTTEVNKEKLMDLLENRGSPLGFEKEELHELIHDDVEFFFNLVRVYCYKNAQVGSILDIRELLNIIGVYLCENTKNKFEISVEGVDEREINNYSNPLTNSLITYAEEEEEEFSSKFLNIKKKVPEVKEEKPIAPQIEKVNLKAKYVILSTLKGSKIEKSVLYSLASYTEQKILKELPNYFPIGALDYHDLFRARTESEVNVLLMSSDIKYKALALKHMETNHLNDKYEEVVLQRNMRAREMAFKAIHDDINHIETMSTHYAKRGGINYLEQKEDQFEVQKKKVENLKDPIEKQLAADMLNEMKFIYDNLHKAASTENIEHIKQAERDDIKKEEQE